MAVPEFIVALRAKIGTAPLWLSGVTAVVIRPTTHGDEILLVQRNDNYAWTPVTGIIDPGEEPAVAAVREVREEAGVTASPEALVWVHTIPEVVYPNGDRTQYLDLTFRMRWESGEPTVSDDENVATGWYRLDRLPGMSGDMRRRIEVAVANPDRTVFEFS